MLRSLGPHHRQEPIGELATYAERIRERRKPATDDEGIHDDGLGRCRPKEVIQAVQRLLST